MDYPSLCLNQELIDEAFLETKPKHTKDPFDQKKWAKRDYHKKKEIRSLSGEVEECDQCDYKTTKTNAMYSHKRVKHIGEKKKCSQCDYSHVYPTKLRTHFKIVHLGLKWGTMGLQQCRNNVCENFGESNCLDIETHKLFSCNLCQMSFKRKDRLLNHKLGIHEGLKFYCEHCPSFSTIFQRSLKQHKLLKHTEKGLKPKAKTEKFCNEEGCTFSSRDGGLRRHTESKHEGIVRFKCHVMNCKFGTTRDRDLQIHLESHTKSKRKPWIGFVVCDEEGCEIKFKDNKELKQHMEYSHEGKARYRCELKQCNFGTYYGRSRLDRHIRTKKHQNSAAN